jgi:DNA polymerase-3 subunit alpha
MDSKNSRLKAMVYAGAKAKGLVFSQALVERLDLELSTIEKAGCADYVLVYKGIIDICNEHDLLRSPGRGSACGSLVNYCLDITKINPLEENLIFERFLNIAHTKQLDIDIDIPMGKRGLVLEELKKAYPDYHIHLVAFEPPKAGLETSINLNGVTYREHPCAIIISKASYPSIPQAEIGSNRYYLIHEYPKGMKKLEAHKFDVLELEYLNRLEQIAVQLDPKFHPYVLDKNDPETLAFFANDDLENIFQFSSKSLGQLLADFKPTRFQDLIIMNALFRPGAIPNIARVIRNKNQGYPEFYPSEPKMAMILAETYGLILYQETFMHIAVQVAGFSYTEADSYRRVLARTDDYNLVEKFKVEFEEACKKNSRLTAVEIEHLRENCVQSMAHAFNKSHSASYATVAFWCAYYKTHFRDVFERVFSADGNG